MLKVAFNAIALLTPLTGIGQYSYQIAQGLLDHPEIEPEFFWGSSWSGGLPAHHDTPQAISWLSKVRRLVPGAYGVRRMMHERVFRRHTRGGRFDLYHEPNIMLLPFDGPGVVTVHDLSWIRYPETHPGYRVRALNRHFESGLRRATRIVTDSAFVKQELIEVFGVDPGRIRPVLLGVEPDFQPRSADQTRATLARHGLEHGRYLLAVGTLEPRKNLRTVLDAYARLPEAVRARTPLVLVGMMGWRTSSLEAQLAPLVASGQVRLLGYVPRTDLGQIIAGGISLVYPSIYEGFGLPPLEAMACAVPPIVSNVSSLPEVVGDAGVSLDPFDIDGMTEAMRYMIEDESARASLALRARERAQTFTWDRAVAQTIAVYREALGTSA
jgi:glycosyltransferase involved in cell wall biosynthesis